MNKLGLVLGGISCFAMMSGAFAADSYTAKVGSAGETCTMTAKIMTMNDQKGILFTANASDNDRLDAHCDNVVLKLQNGQQVFVFNMTEADLANCRFDEHQAKAGADDESNKLTSSKFIAD